MITDLGILTPDPVSRELTLTSVHPGIAVEQVVAATGWPLKVDGHAPWLKPGRFPRMSKPIAVVTGASKGIGRAIAMRLAATHDIVGVARSETDLDALAHEIAAAGGQRISVGSQLSSVAIAAFAQAAEQIRDAGDFAALRLIPRMLGKRAQIDRIRKLTPREVRRLLLAHRLSLTEVA